MMRRVTRAELIEKGTWRLTMECGHTAKSIHPDDQEVNCLACAGPIDLIERRFRRSVVLQGRIGIRDGHAVSRVELECGHQTTIEGRVKGSVECQQCRHDFESAKRLKDNSKELLESVRMAISHWEDGVQMDGAIRRLKLAFQQVEGGGE